LRRHRWNLRNRELFEYVEPFERCILDGAQPPCGCAPSWMGHSHRWWLCPIKAHKAQTSKVVEHGNRHGQMRMFCVSANPTVRRVGFDPEPLTTVCATAIFWHLGLKIVNTPRPQAPGRETLARPRRSSTLLLLILYQHFGANLPQLPTMQHQHISGRAVVSTVSGEGPFGRPDS
jgi:hypothetical protein